MSFLQKLIIAKYLNLIESFNRKINLENKFVIKGIRRFKKNI